VGFDFKAVGDSPGRHVGYSHQGRAFYFQTEVQINPAGTALLSQALNGRLYEKEKTEKKNYHVVNAFTLLLTRLELWKAMPKAQKPLRTPPSCMSV
jgi:hypothetical protein